MPTATLLLPARERFAGQALPEGIARALGRARPGGGALPGERAQLLRHFELLPRGWPVAALTRQLDAGDAELGAWLRADPAYVRPDINGVRLLATGDVLQLTQEDVDALLPALRPLFGDAGFPIDAPSPSRWYLRLPREAKLPQFAEPAEALGTDLFDHLPGVDDERPEGRRWRALLSDAQVVLHNHPWNAQRLAEGKLPVNSLWFWGAGLLPDHVTARHRRLHSDDTLLRALANASGTAATPLASPFMPPVEGSALYDLRALRNFAWLVGDWLEPAILALQAGGIDSLRLDFEDGAGYLLDRGQRWRFWRRPLRVLHA
jgi:hypothetical protein